ncbi:MAG: hypothetical protein V7K30_07080 [Nostoc sp.]
MWEGQDLASSSVLLGLFHWSQFAIEFDDRIYPPQCDRTFYIG